MPKAGTKTAVMEDDEVQTTSQEPEIEIVTDDEVSASPEEGKPETAQPKPEGEGTGESDVDAAVRELKAQVDAANTARIAAENQARENAERATKAEGENKQFRSQTHENQYNLVVSQLEAVSRETDVLETQLGQAIANNDFAAQAKLQRAISRNEAKAEQLELGKSALEARKTDGADDTVEVHQPQPRQSSDPVGDFIRNLPVGEAEKAYLSKHQDAITDQGKWNKLIASASYASNSKGLKAGSAEYFAFLDAEMGYGEKEPEVVRQQQVERKQPSYSAPVSREGNGMSGERPKGQKIRLSPEQREAAKASGITDAEYAKNLIKLGESDPSIAATIKYVN